LTKVTLVIFVHDGNGMMAACLLMYAMFLDMVLPVFPVSFVLCPLQRTKDEGQCACVLVIQINEHEFGTV